MIDLDDYLTDPNGDTLTFTPDTLPPAATFNPETNEVTFVSPVDNNGDTVIQFSATDSNGGTITPTLTIQPVNLLPVAVDELVRTPFETPIDIDLLENDFDPDGDPLSVSVINGVQLPPGLVQEMAVTAGTETVANEGTNPAASDNAVLANDSDSITIDVPNGTCLLYTSDAADE